jgi:DtxR family Mn-dependent transcriptional regulator
VVPGLTLVVLERAPFGGPLWVRFDGRDHALGEPLTRLVHGQEIRAGVPA